MLARRFSIAAACALAGCAAPKLTVQSHAAAEGCSVSADGSAISCGGRAYATLECTWAYGGCTRLALRYADGDVARLYEASGDPRLDTAAQIMTAADGTRIWFLTLEGPQAARRWREYDVSRGKLWDVGEGMAEAAAGRAAAIPLATQARR